MKLKIWLCAMAATGAVVTASAAGASAAARETAGENAESFIIGVCQDYVAVFDGQNSSVPPTVTDIEIKTLPSADRECLENGIRASSREEMLLLLEDLGS